MRLQRSTPRMGIGLLLVLLPRPEACADAPTRTSQTPPRHSFFVTASEPCQGSACTCGRSCGAVHACRWASLEGCATPTGMDSVPAERTPGPSRGSMRSTSGRTMHLCVQMADVHGRRRRVGA